MSAHKLRRKRMGREEPFHDSLKYSAMGIQSHGFFINEPRQDRAERRSRN